MKLGMVGLGRMGGDMSRRLLRSGHEVVAFDVNPAAVQALAAEGAVGAMDLPGMIASLPPPRAAWVMVPAGPITESTIQQLGQLLAPGDAIVDGGNSHYTDTLVRAEALAQRGITLIDSGTSGGIWGLEGGYCLMVGGDEAACRALEPIFTALAPAGGYLRVGPPGSGHFTKMVHNGIEYALMQAYAEGFELLRDGPMQVDIASVAELWRHGSVVRSWLLDLAASALARDPSLAGMSSVVQDSGEGRWTVNAAVDAGIPIPTIAMALFARFSSQRPDAFSGKVLSALRHEFGGHTSPVPPPAAPPPPPQQ